ncbi:MAG: hypothetical protein OXU81_23095 [Gammaproteobacteria bacterium]|nr:hypothetical protein [Gammaproteobacteria bacterium]
MADEAPRAPAIPAERDVPGFARSAPARPWVLAAVIFLAVVVAVAGGWIAFREHVILGPEEEVAEDGAKLGVDVPREPVEAPAPEPVPVVEEGPTDPVDPFAVTFDVPELETTAPPPGSGAADTQKSPEELARERRLGSSVAGAAAGGGLVPGDVGDEEGGPVRAARLRGLGMLIMRGTSFTCALLTRIVSEVPGTTSCIVTEDVYSTDGTTVLVDRGAKLIGSYSGSLRQGQARLAVMWERLQDTAGLVVELASPASGPVGEAGVGGWVDRKWMERFGNALLISLVVEEATNRVAVGERTEQTMDRAFSELMTQALNIPPTLYKHQGEIVTVIAARDIDMSRVYRLARE